MKGTCKWVDLPEGILSRNLFIHAGITRIPDFSCSDVDCDSSDTLAWRHRRKSKDWLVRSFRLDHTSVFDARIGPLT